MSMSLLMFFKKVNPSTCLLTMPINMNFFLCDRNHLVAIKWCFCVIESLFSWNQLMATNQSFVLWHFFFFTIKTTKWSFSCDKILLLLVTKTIWQSPCEFFTFGMEFFFWWSKPCENHVGGFYSSQQKPHGGHQMVEFDIECTLKPLKVFCIVCIYHVCYIRIFLNVLFVD